MGKDTYKLTKPRTVRTEPASENPYLGTLVRLYRFQARRNATKFNKMILHRLMLSKTNRASMSLSRIAKMAGPKNTKTIVIPTTILDDKRIAKIPQMTVCALKFSESARQRIIAAGGKCMTFDQLATANPSGSNTILMRGRKSRREVCKSFGAPGVPGSHAKPKVANRRNEMARGKRASREWKVKTFKYSQY